MIQRVNTIEKTNGICRDNDQHQPARKRVKAISNKSNDIVTLLSERIASRSKLFNLISEWGLLANRKDNLPLIASVYKEKSSVPITDDIETFSNIILFQKKHFDVDLNTLAVLITEMSKMNFSYVPSGFSFFEKAESSQKLHSTTLLIQRKLFSENEKLKKLLFNQLETKVLSRDLKKLNSLVSRFLYRVLLGSRKCKFSEEKANQLLTKAWDRVEIRKICVP